MRKNDDSTSKNTVAWRDSDGQIKCPGDNCSQECDEKCPMFCKIFAETSLKLKIPDEAITYLKTAVEIAPDFKDAWATMGDAYLRVDNFPEAYKAYKTAYDLDNKFADAVQGLILYHTHLGQYEEALKYCDEYESIVNRKEANKRRVYVYFQTTVGDLSSQGGALGMAIKLIAHSKHTKELDASYRIPLIPEVLAEAENVCQTLYKRIAKGNFKDRLFTRLNASLYAGVGAAFFWKEDWNSYKEKGIAETLLKPRGAKYIADTVYEDIGIDVDELDGMLDRIILSPYKDWIVDEFFNGIETNATEQMVLEAMQAEYIFGMIYYTTYYGQ